MRIKNRPGLIVVLFFVVVFINTTFCQYELEKRKYTKYIALEYIYNIDTSNCLDKSLFSRTDSIKCISFNNYSWFLFAEKKINHDIKGRVIAINEKENKIYPLKNSALGMSSIFTTINILDIFDNHLFIQRYYDHNLDEGEAGGIQISLIDTKKPKISREIYLENNAWSKHIYERNDSLFIEVQQIEPKINYSYFFFFWMPRGTPSKYHYQATENIIRYIFDKSFTLVRKEKIIEEKSKFLY